MEKKLNLGVVFGGQSGEHEVSCVSAFNILKAINEEKYNIINLGITKTGKWYLYRGEYHKIRDGSWLEDIDNLEDDISFFNQPLCDIDIFFPVLHGPMGEDGTLQGVFEMLNKPYVGCGVLASAVGMDKVFSKIMFEHAQIPTGRYLYFNHRDWNKLKTEKIKEIEDELKYPVFVKPANLGSSVGINKAHDQQELIAAIEEAFQYDRKVILEAFIKGREIECAVLEDGDSIKASIAGEVIPSKEFYDYEAKYSDDQNSRVVIPADIDEKSMALIRDYAIRAFEAIEGSGLSRVDFFLTENNQILINEVNTLPGFTNISMYPKMWEATGIDCADLVERMIKSAKRNRLVIS